jgi:hypothetical protein
MTEDRRKQKILRFIEKLNQFFPVKLLLNHLKYDHLVLLLWIFPYLIIFGVFGEKLGIPTLFLAPNFRGNIDIWSFLFMGLSTGSFIMAYHIASYILLAHRVPFIVTLSRPFYIYSLNNSLISVVYIWLYLYKSFNFQIDYELIAAKDAVINLLFFVGGYSAFVFLSFRFFTLMNKINDIRKALRKKEKKGIITKIIEKHKEFKVSESPKNNTGMAKVAVYFKSPFAFSHSREFSHYDKQKLVKVFSEQHRNSLLYILIILTFIIIRGLMKDSSSMVLPAGSSLQLFLTLIMLITGLFYIVFKNWAFVAFIVLLLVGNYFLAPEINNYNNNAYGLSYVNTNDSLDMFQEGYYKADSLLTINIFNKWRHNIIKKERVRKPKMVMICTSGGGLKLAFWTYYSLAYADSLTHNKLMSRIRLMTGASGGMLGAAYIRELYLQKLNDSIDNIYLQKYKNEITLDILNPVMYGFATSDWFVRLQKFSYNGYKYYKDRGYLFEKRLNQNTGGILDKPLYMYRKPEQEAKIPMMIFSPALINTGARLLISPVEISYLCKSAFTGDLRNIEFTRIYKKFGADSLRFTTAIRMSASFPYVSPQVTLPGKPNLTVIDAGFSDNNGFLDTYHFIMQFKEWILKNTSGVIIIRLDQNEEVDYTFKLNFINRILSPFSSIFRDWFYIQENSYYPVLQSLNKVLKGRLSIVHLGIYVADKNVSLSWHLTRQEKQIIESSIYSPQNQKELQRLKKLLQSEN